MTQELASLINSLRNLPLSFMAALAIGSAAFLYMANFVEINRHTQSIALLFFMIFWMLLVSSSYLMIYGLNFFLKKASLWHKEQKRRARILKYLDINERSMEEAKNLVAHLVVMKKQGLRQFDFPNEDDTSLATLCKKGLLVKGLRLPNNAAEFEVPDFVWKSRKLKKLTKNETLDKD